MTTNEPDTDKSQPAVDDAAAPLDVFPASEITGPVSLERQAYDAILGWLVQGHGAQGQAIPLREFARALGMSRTPLRTALGRLQEQGLVAYSPRLGFMATSPSAAELRQLFEIRMMCETYAVRRCFEQPDCLNAYADEIARLARQSWEIVNAETITPEIAQSFWDADNRLHRAIVSLSHNRKLVEWWELLHTNIHVARAGMRARMTPERFQISAREHLAIADAMVANDGERAVELLESHLTRVRDQTVRFVTSTDERDRQPAPSPRPAASLPALSEPLARTWEENILAENNLADH